MKIILTEKEGKGLYINSFGYENIWHNAHWGKGSREVYILHYIIKGEKIHVKQNGSKASGKSKRHDQVAVDLERDQKE